MGKKIKNNGLSLQQLRLMCQMKTVFNSKQMKAAFKSMQREQGIKVTFQRKAAARKDPFSIKQATELTDAQLNEIICALLALGRDKEDGPEIAIPIVDLAAFFRASGVDIKKEMASIVAFYEICAKAGKQDCLQLLVQGKDMRDIVGKKGHAVDIFMSMRAVAQAKSLGVDECVEFFDLWLGEAEIEIGQPIAFAQVLESI